MKKIHRPLPQGFENVGYANHFELRYLRWDYLVKAENPEYSVLKEKEAIIRYCARKAYTKYRYEFGFMSMDIEDIENISRVYTVSFLGLYSSKKNNRVKERHSKKLAEQTGKAPSNFEIERKDNKALIAFLNQRLMECAYVFRQKSKGQAGFNYYSVFVRKKGEEWPTDQELMTHPTKFGWEKVSWSTFLKIRKFFNHATPGCPIELEGKIYRVASPETSLVYPEKDEQVEEAHSNDWHNTSNPEDLLIRFEEEKSIPVRDSNKTYAVSLEERISNLVSLFKERSLADQERILARFQRWLKRRNGFQKEMQEEIRQVSQMLTKIREKRDNEAHGAQ